MAEKEIPSAILQEVQARFDKAIFGPPDENSVFVAWPNDEHIRVSEAILDRETELRESSKRFFAMLDGVLETNSDVIIRSKAVSINDDGSTFSRAALELKSKSYPVPGAVKDQLWITDHGPNMEDNSPERIDKAIASQRAVLLGQFSNLSKRNTSRAAEERKKVLELTTRISRVPIATTNIQFQTEQSRTIDPKLGIRIIEYLDGFQAFPVVYEGKNAVVLYERPLFNEAKHVKIEELAFQLPFGLVPVNEFRKTELSSIVFNLFKKAHIS